VMIEMSCEIYCAGEFSSVDGPPGGPEARCETSGPPPPVVAHEKLGSAYWELGGARGMGMGY